MTTELQPQKPDRLIVRDDGPVANLCDSARFEQMQRIAVAMAHASLIPDHLHGDSTDPKQRWDQTVANCLLIVNQALRWDMDPFAVAPETYVVAGKLGFQGKLVAAVVHARGNLTGRLGYSFHGEGDGRTVTVAGQFADESKARTITLSVGQAKTFDKQGKLMPMWKNDPDQKLVYSGVTKWARRHCPELMLGVLTLDDLDRMQTSRLDGSAVADHAAQARQLRQSKETPPDPRVATGALTVEDTPPYSPPTAEEIAAELSRPLDAQSVSPDAPEEPVEPDRAEPQAPEPAAESPQPPVSPMDLEIRYFEDIQKQTMIRPVNTLEIAIKEDPDLSADAIKRLESACENQRVLIRGKRG